MSVAAEELARKKRRVRIAKWAIFTVIFGIVPLMATYAISDGAFDVRILIGHGELFIIAAVLMGDGLARIANANALSDYYGIACLGALVLILASASLEFGSSSKDLIDGKVITDHHMWVSFTIFVAAVATAYAAVILEE